MMCKNRFALTNEDVARIVAMVQKYIFMCYRNTHEEREEMLESQLVLAIMVQDLTCDRDKDPYTMMPWIRLLCAAADCADWSEDCPDHFPEIYGDEILINRPVGWMGEDNDDFCEDNCTLEEFIGACLAQIYRR